MKNISMPLLIVLTGSILLGISGCQRGDQGTKTDQPVIALVMKTLNNPFFIDMQKGARAAADSFGVELLVQAAEREVDVEKQMQIVENLIQRKVAALCITPSGSKEIVPAIVKANERNIPVLIVDTRVDEATLTAAGGKIATFIGSDNYEGGRIAGLYLAEKLGNRGKVAVLEGIPGHETGDARLSGFHDVLAQFSDMEIVASQTANWERDQGFNVFQNILQSHPEVQALFACSDLMALGAIEAIAAAGRTGEIIVVGFDAIVDARGAIAENTMSGSVAQHPYDMGWIAVESAQRLIAGGQVAEYIPVKIELITRENLE
ncbi:MAG: sugar ABC transporter substrate-binding protein [Fidelibacterota bacterium]|nr:MAG: sugar ABC transporter substrate-binding protein [Candidatus Neomarinimicrobiota bacterium]